MNSLHFNFKPVEECGQKVLVLDKVSGGFADRQLFDHLSLLLRRGEAASLIGPNGTGKTTLIRMIMGEKEPTDGHITLGSRVHIGYFAQEHTDLHGAWTVLDEIMNDFSYGEEEARSVLGRFMFRGDDVFKVIDSLSGGEQARLAPVESSSCRGRISSSSTNRRTISTSRRGKSWNRPCWNSAGPIWSYPMTAISSTRSPSGRWSWKISSSRNTSAITVITGKRSAKPRKRQKRRQLKGKVPRRLMKKKPLRQPRRRNHQPLRP